MNWTTIRSATGAIGVVGALLLSARQSHATIVALSDNNSVAHVDVSSSAGMSDWRVDGQNQLNQQWFWYRVGNVNPEASIDTISAPSITQPNARTLQTVYNNGSFSVEVDYLMTGGLAGSGQSDIGESIRINNLTANLLDFHFFQYSDVDLGGVVGGQTVQLGKNLHNLFNEALQTGPVGTLDESTTVDTPGANHGEANVFNATLVKLNNGVPDTLNDNVGPVGPGDVTWALQWDFSIAPGGSALISKDKFLTVPEPSSLVLISLGLACLARRGFYRRWAKS
jgi:hypothetical protein